MVRFHHYAPNNTGSSGRFRSCLLGSREQNDIGSNPITRAN
ncbi:hypothetical protein VPHD249_0091 [Vibrio phage D249]